MIPFNKAAITDLSKRYVLEALSNQKVCGDGPFTKMCHKKLKKIINAGGGYC